MSGQTADKLVYMANQIARNLAHDDRPAASVAHHITEFWTRSMTDALLAHGSADLDPVVAEALGLIRAKLT